LMQGTTFTAGILFGKLFPYPPTKVYQGKSKRKKNYQQLHI
jgi:hypothetical protein